MMEEDNEDQDDSSYDDNFDHDHGNGSYGTQNNDDDSEVVVVEDEPKRKRGRPSKKIDNKDDDHVPIKRKRGRPTKSADNTKRKRGRPTKSADNTKRKRGRPTKSADNTFLGGKKVKCNPVQTGIDDSEMNDVDYNNDRNRKYIDRRQTHLHRPLTNQQYEAELMKMQLILTSKGGTRDSLTTVYSTLINAKQFKQAEKIMTQLMAEIHAIRDIQNVVLAMQMLPCEV
jgi:hypothetical protein